MRIQNLKHIKSIKEILEFLNSNFPGQHYNKFIAYLPPDREEGEFPAWHVVTDDWFLYAGQTANNEEFRLCKEAIWSKFKFKTIFCFQHNVTSRIKQKKGFLLVK